MFHASGVAAHGNDEPGATSLPRNSLSALTEINVYHAGNMGIAYAVNLIKLSATIEKTHAGLVMRLRFIWDIPFDTEFIAT